MIFLGAVSDRDSILKIFLWIPKRFKTRLDHEDDIIDYYEFEPVSNFV